jgi:ATP-dependent DNA ligase
MTWRTGFPAIVDAALRIKTSSFLIDGEVVIARDDGTPDFHALRSRHQADGGRISGGGCDWFEAP